MIFTISLLLIVLWTVIWREEKKNLPSQVLQSPWDARTSQIAVFQMLPSKDINFVCYAYMNFEIVNDHELPGIAELKKKSNRTKRPTGKSLFADESDHCEPTCSWKLPESLASKTGNIKAK